MGDLFDELKNWDKLPEFPVDTRFKVVPLPWEAVDAVLSMTGGEDVCGDAEVAEITRIAIDYILGLDGGSFDDAHLAIVDVDSDSLLHQLGYNVVATVIDVTRRLLMERQAGVLEMGKVALLRWRGLNGYSNVIVKQSNVASSRRSPVATPRLIPDSPYLVSERIYENVDGGVVTFAPRVHEDSVNDSWTDGNVDLAANLPILIDAICGIRDLHKAGIIHRDISLGNILKSGQVCDFEFAVDKKDYIFGTMFYGTPPLMHAIYLKSSVLKKMTPEYHDIFPLSLLLIMLCFGDFRRFWEFLVRRFPWRNRFDSFALNAYNLDPDEFVSILEGAVGGLALDELRSNCVRSLTWFNLVLFYAIIGGLSLA